MKEKINVLIDKEAISSRIKELGEQISRDYAGKELHIIGVLKGSVFFMCELAKHISVPVSLDFMSISSYAGTKSTGIVKIIKDLDEPITGREVLLVEDIVDTGRSLKYLMGIFTDKRPKSLKLCTLLDKPSGRVVDGIEVEYRGFEIPDAFIVGYGLDYDQKYRNLPYIGVLEFIPEEAE